VAGGWRRLHNEELHNLYTAPNVIWVVTLRRVVIYAYKILVVKPHGRNHLGDPILSSKIILKWALKK
jgi:hypothetical protein